MHGYARLQRASAEESSVALQQPAGKCILESNQQSDRRSFIYHLMIVPCSHERSPWCAGHMEPTRSSGVELYVKMIGGSHERNHLSRWFDCRDHGGAVVPRDALIVSALGERPLLSPIDWAASFAGAVIAAGISATLLAFGSAIGLSVVSTAPTWRDTSPWLWMISGLFLLLTALASFGFGGYVAGRLRHRLGLPDNSETHFRDGIHGLMTWGLAIVFTAIVTAIGATALARPAAVTDASQSVIGETLIASELDALFRSDRRIDMTDLSYRRSEAARLLLKSSGHDGIAADDQDYLTAMVSATTGIGASEANDRVQRAIAQSKDAVHRARQATVLEAFMIAAALLLGAAAAWMSSVEGGLDRENGRVFVWNWGRRIDAPTLGRK